jgi:hypothetical protein
MTSTKVQALQGVEAAFGHGPAVQSTIGASPFDPRRLYGNGPARPLAVPSLCTHAPFLALLSLEGM